MDYNNYDEQLGTIYGDGQTGVSPPIETVINGVTYRTENGKVFRKQNGQLIPVTDQQELLALDRQYIAPATVGFYPIGDNPNHTGTGAVLLVVGALALFFLSRK